MAARLDKRVRGRALGGLLRNTLRGAYVAGARLYLQPLLKREWQHSPFPVVNERCVEYGFALRTIASVRPRDVLDVGTGTTAWPHLLANCGFHVTAVDEIRGYWREPFLNRHFHVIDDDITDSRLGRRFDVVTCISVLEHIPDHRAAVAGMFRLLRPGGHLVLTIPYNEGRYVEDVYALPEAHVAEPLPYVCQVYSRAEVDEWAALAGAELVEQEYYAGFTGELHGFGESLGLPRPVTREDRHHLTCLLMRKLTGSPVEAAAG